MKTIVTLTRYPEIFERFKQSVDYWEPYARKIVVTSGGVKINAPGWEAIEGIEPFIFARNANLGLKMVTGDVLLANDDCELTQSILETLCRITKTNPNIGILSPQIDGGVGGNKLQKVHKSNELYYISKRRLMFACVYIPAKTLALIGQLDESFIGYGCEDDDYCYRIQKAGLDLAITGKVTVKHGYKNQISSSFLREMNTWERNWSMVKMWLKLKNKQYKKENESTNKESS